MDPDENQHLVGSGLTHSYWLNKQDKLRKFAVTGGFELLNK